jgi:hypothetical protein
MPSRATRLSPVATTLVIEKESTIRGKPLKDHFEGIEHYEVRNLHKLVMQQSAPEIAGQHASLPCYVRTRTGRYSLSGAGSRICSVALRSRYLFVQ